MIGNPLIPGYSSNTGTFSTPVDGLSLDLAFALDKTLVARRGPTPQFSRASSGTFVNANGIIVGKTAGTTTSITPSATVIGSQVTVTVASGSVVGWVVGQAISLIVDTDADDQPDADELWLLGNIVSATPTTLTFTVTSRTTQSGAATSWTLAYRGARFDHDPVTGICRGLLIEEGGRTNLFAQSEEWATGAGYTGPTTPIVTNNTTTSPDGQLTADTLSGATGTSADGSVNSTLRQPSVSSATVYTFSIYVRSLGVATRAEIRIRDNTTGVSTQTLDTSLTSSWKRISVTATTSATTNSIRCIIQNTDGPIAIWGAQLEAGSFTTSYIPTTTTALSRSADVCSIANTSSFWNSAEFTLFTNANWVASGFDSYSSNFNITAGFFGARRSSTNQAVAIIRSSGVSADINFGSFTTGSMRMAITHSTGQQAASLNGASAVQSNSAFVPSLNPPFNIGGSGAGAYINGHIARIQYFKKRLPNAKLQSLTAP